jgi:very-short-patch-repair endonuclease
MPAAQEVTMHRRFGRSIDSPAHVRLVAHASQMRAVPTQSEHLLWQRLRGNQLGVAFRRQVPIGGRFIADFLAPKARLVVEVDGGYHKLRQAADERRDRLLGRLGYRVLRITAELVERDIGAAVAAVRVALTQIAR